eukprot:gene7683-5388_t
MCKGKPSNSSSPKAPTSHRAGTAGIQEAHGTAPTTVRRARTHTATERRSALQQPPGTRLAPPRDEREETLKKEEEGRTKRQGAGRGKQHVSALEAQQCHTQVCTAYHADRPLHQHQHISQAGGCSEGSRSLRRKHHQGHTLPMMCSGMDHKN